MTERLLQRFGPQEWWPTESPFEIMVGAILVQNTNWRNAEQAINNLKKAGVFSLSALLNLKDSELAEFIRPSGYLNVKKRRLKALLHFLSEKFGGNVESMLREPLDRLREGLLSVKGVGRETADSILLYALKYPQLPIDTYTYRVLTRHHLAGEEVGYDELQEVAMGNLEPELFNEFHAQIVRVGQEYCAPEPKCEDCPLKGLNW